MVPSQGNYSGTDCASSKKYGWQDFLSFNQYAFKDKYHGIATQEDLNKISYKICKDLRGPRTLKCSDLRPYMNAHIPKRLWPDYSDIKQQELNHFVAVSDNTRVNLPQLDRFQIEKKLEINNKDLNNFRCSF